MRTTGWKLYDDGTSAEEIGTPFRVSYFLRDGADERFLYYATEKEAFRFVQDHPELDRPHIKRMDTMEVLFPKGQEA